MRQAAGRLLTLGFAPTNWAVTVSPALYGLLPTSIRTWPKSFPKGVLSTITCVYDSEKQLRRRFSQNSIGAVKGHAIQASGESREDVAAN